MTKEHKHKHDPLAQSAVRRLSCLIRGHPSAVFSRNHHGHGSRARRTDTNTNHEHEPEIHGHETRTRTVSERTAGFCQRSMRIDGGLFHVRVPKEVKSQRYIVPYIPRRIT
jgi:hypothetical protein